MNGTDQHPRAHAQAPSTCRPTRPIATRALLVLSLLAAAAACEDEYDCPDGLEYGNLDGRAFCGEPCSCPGGTCLSDACPEGKTCMQHTYMPEDGLCVAAGGGGVSGDGHTTPGGGCGLWATCTDPWAACCARTTPFYACGYCFSTEEQALDECGSGYFIYPCG